MELNDFQYEILKTRYMTPRETAQAENYYEELKKASGSVPGLWHIINDHRKYAWHLVAERVSNQMSMCELNGETGQQDRYREEFYEMIYNGWFMPAGRVLYGSGRLNAALLNCFALGVQDNRQSIAELMSNMYLISTAGGGVGWNVSYVRPRGASIRDIPGAAPGIVSEMKMIDSIGARIKCGGGRRVALLCACHINHPDILEFVEVKKDREELNNHNISIYITDEFLDAVKKDKEWQFKFAGKVFNTYEVRRNKVTTTFTVNAPDERHALEICKNHHKKNHGDTFTIVGLAPMKAREIWDAIISSAVENGEPGIIFIDNVIENFATSYFEKFCNPNPCGEALLPEFGCCCLGSLNLPMFFDDRYKDNINMKLLKDVVFNAVRFLDNVLTVNDYPIPETKIASQMSRRIGMGTTGLAYLLIKCGMRYGSEESLEFVDKLYSNIRNYAFEASIELSKEKGPFPKFDSERYLKNQFIRRLPSRIKTAIKKYGVRNAVLMSVAPTGTVSMVAGVPSGIEPIFAPLYERTYYETGAGAKPVKKTEVVMDKLFAEQYLDQIVTPVDGTPAKLIDENFVGAYDVTPEEHIAMQCAVQDYVDQAISKTINLPADYTEETLSSTLLEYTDHFKSVTFYREGSRGEEPLKAIPVSQDAHVLDAAQRAVVLNQECEGGSCEM